MPIAPAARVHGDPQHGSLKEWESYNCQESHSENDHDQDAIEDHEEELQVFLDKGLWD